MSAEEHKAVFRNVVRVWETGGMNEVNVCSPRITSVMWPQVTAIVTA